MSGDNVNDVCTSLAQVLIYECRLAGYSLKGILAGMQEGAPGVDGLVVLSARLLSLAGEAEKKLTQTTIQAANSTPLDIRTIH